MNTVTLISHHTDNTLTLPVAQNLDAALELAKEQARASGLVHFIARIPGQRGAVITDVYGLNWLERRSGPMNVRILAAIGRE